MPATPVNITIRKGGVFKPQSLSQDVHDKTLPADDHSPKADSSAHSSRPPFTQNPPDDSQAIPGKEDQLLNKEPRAPFRLEPLRGDMAKGSAAPGREFSDSEHGNRRWVIIGWFIFSFTFLILAPIISVVLGATLHIPDLSYNPESTNFTGRTLQLLAILVSADPTSSTITFDWIISGEVNSTCISANATLDACPSVNIYLDNNLLINSDSSSDIPTNDIPTVPVFRYNALVATSNDSRARTPIFRTNFKTISQEFSQSSLVSYPFDSYFTQIFMFAQDINNNSVGLSLETAGNAVGFSTSATDVGLTELDPPGMLSIVITLQRGHLVRAFCVVVVTAIWLITLILFLLTFTSIIFGFRQKVEVLVVPVATIFAFTQLRASMPGAPEGFGDIIDFVGLLPCLGILTFSAAMSLGAFLLTDPSSKTNDVMTWKLLRSEFTGIIRARRAQNAKKYPQE